MSPVHDAESPRYDAEYPNPRSETLGLIRAEFVRAIGNAAQSAQLVATPTNTDSESRSMPE